MFVLRAVALACLFVLGALPATAQELSRYRDFQLESSVAAVLTSSGASASQVQSMHERPGRIQELEWHPPYVAAGTRVDPLDSVTFGFYDDKLYQMVVTYDRERMTGLTDRDVIEALSSTYGAPQRTTRPARQLRVEERLTYVTVLAQWISPTTELTLTRDVDSPQFQLLLSAKPLAVRARAAIKEAVRLDVQDAPGLARAKVRQDALDAEQARKKNRAAFRP
jgi:hypothetical protein